MKHVSYLWQTGTAASLNQIAKCFNMDGIWSIAMWLKTNNMQIEILFQTCF